MPAKHVVKQYVAGGTYHCINRGIDGREIFTDEEATQTFRHLLEYYLTMKPEAAVVEAKSSSGRGTRARAIAGKIELLAYCLAPDHYHLLLRQKSANALGTFMQCVCSTYAMYFNQRQRRSGPLYQGTYKAILIPESAMPAVITHLHAHPCRVSSREAYENPPAPPWISPLAFPLRSTAPVEATPYLFD